MEKYLVDNNEVTMLRRFAKVSGMNQKLKDLSELAEPERWTIKNPHDLLYNYVFSVFDLALKQNLVYESDDQQHAVFNTGLMTPNGQDIFGVFVRNSDTAYPQYWYLSNFLKDSARWLMENFKSLPEYVTHFSNPSDAYFDSTCSIRKEIDHILDDNYARLPERLKTLDEDTIRMLLNGAIDVSLRKVKRNNRLVVPQLYFGQITYLMPIDLFGEKFALALEKINNQYRANTIFNLEMAYMQARLVMKPESDWLIKAVFKQDEI